MRKWDPQTEEFVCLPEDEAYRYAEGVRAFDFDKTMGPYPLEYRQKWENLSSFITPEVLSKIEPVGKNIKQASLSYRPEQDEKTLNENLARMASENDTEMQNDEAENEDESKEDEKDSLMPTYDGAAPRLFFTTIPKPQAKHGATAEQVTHANLDKTHILSNLIQEHAKAEDVLGEFQFAYATFILGQNFSGFDQWKEMMGIFCGSEAAIFEKHTNLMTDFVRVFYDQLQQMPDDLFTDDLLENNFLTQCVASFLAICGDERTPIKVQKRANHLATLVKQKFLVDGEELMLGTLKDGDQGGTFADEDALMAHLASLGEDAPIIA